MDTYNQMNLLGREATEEEKKDLCSLLKESEIQFAYTLTNRETMEKLLKSHEKGE